jgi:hypothetical protein
MKVIPLLRGFTEIEKLYTEVTARQGIICGGYARYCASPINEPVKAGDADVFPLVTEAFETLKQFFVSEGFAIKHENDISLTFHPHTDIKWIACPIVQLIKPAIEGKVVTLGTMENILNNFDFAIVRAGIVNAKEVMVDDDFEADEKSKMLHIKNIHCPISSVFRLIKYTKRGYWVTPREVLKLFVDWENRDDEYRLKIVELFKKSESFDPDAPDESKGGLSKEEIDELEELMRID